MFVISITILCDVVQRNEKFLHDILLKYVDKIIEDGSPSKPEAKSIRKWIEKASQIKYTAWNFFLLDKKTILGFINAVFTVCAVLYGFRDSK